MDFPNSREGRKSFASLSTLYTAARTARYRKFNLDRVLIVLEHGDRARMRIYRLPNIKDVPLCTECLIIKGGTSRAPPPAVHVLPTSYLISNSNGNINIASPFFI